MADELLDGEFWLPSQFLTDDDILMDFKSDTTSASGFGFGLTSGSNSDLASLTSDDDELLHYSKPPAPLSGSPQSTLCGWELSHTDSGSGSGSPQKEQPEKQESDDTKNDDVEDENNKNATLDLLNKAAGEVAKMKLRTERSAGTGFFDCSNTAKAKTLPSPPPPPLSNPNQSQPQPPHFPPPFYYYPQFRRFPPNMIWGPVQYPPPPQQLQSGVTVTKNNSNSKTKDAKSATNGNTNRPLGLPPSAWPPLPGQTQPQPQAQPQTQAQTQPQAQPQQPQPQVQPYMGIFVGPQSASVGTGVFLPRRTTTTEPKKKSDGNMMKTKNNKGTQKRSSVPAKTNNDEIQLPLEWVY